MDYSWLVITERNVFLSKNLFKACILDSFNWFADFSKLTFKLGSRWSYWRSERVGWCKLGVTAMLRTLRWKCLWWKSVHAVNQMFGLVFQTSHPLGCPIWIAWFYWIGEPRHWNCGLLSHCVPHKVFWLWVIFSFIRIKLPNSIIQIINNK